MSCMLLQKFLTSNFRKFFLQVQTPLLSYVPLGQVPTQVDPNATRPPEQLVQVLELLQVTQEPCNVEHAKK